MTKKQTLFFKPKYNKYKKIVSIKSPEEARKSVRLLKNEYNLAKRQDKKVRILRVAVSAMNRANASAKRKNLSNMERREFREVARIYQAAEKEFGFRLNPKPAKYAASYYRDWKKRH